MKEEKATIPFYTTILATLLKEWREQNRISVYAVAKVINASPHTIRRFEQLQGGISLEVGLRYLEYAETHISHPDIFGKFNVAIARYKTEEGQQTYFVELKYKKQMEEKKEQEEHRYMEERIRESVTEELQAAHNSNILLLAKEKQEFAERIANLEQENAMLKKIKQDVFPDNPAKGGWLSKLKKSFD